MVVEPGMGFSPTPPEYAVADLLAADKYSGLRASRLIDTNQPVIRTRNAFSTLVSPS
jgi:hypothetical protein